MKDKNLKAAAIVAASALAYHKLKLPARVVVTPVASVTSAVLVLYWLCKEQRISLNTPLGDLCYLVGAIDNLKNSLKSFGLNWGDPLKPQQPGVSIVKGDQGKSENSLRYSEGSSVYQIIKRQLVVANRFEISRMKNYHYPKSGLVEIGKNVVVTSGKCTNFGNSESAKGLSGIVVDYVFNNTFGTRKKMNYKVKLDKPITQPNGVALYYANIPWSCVQSDVPIGFI